MPYVELCAFDFCRAESLVDVGTSGVPGETCDEALVTKHAGSYESSSNGARREALLGIKA
jgi:hypothetical protein